MAFSRWRDKHKRLHLMSVFSGLAILAEKKVQAKPEGQAKTNNNSVLARKTPIRTTLFACTCTA